MKKIFLTLLTVATLTRAEAQLFSPESWNGALWGSLIGGIVGSDCHHGFSGEGAAIGAGAGLLLGAIAGEARRQDSYRAQPYIFAPAPVVGYGYNYSATPAYSSGYVYYAPNSYSAPGYYYRPVRPNYAVGGTLLGAASGALIGAGEHRAGEGAAIGAAAGLVLGSVAELTTQKREQRLATAQPLPISETSVVPEQAQLDSAQPSPEAKSPQVKSARARKTNAAAAPVLYQIPDAPRVPDAPTF